MSWAKMLERMRTGMIRAFMAAIKIITMMAEEEREPTLAEEIVAEREPTLAEEIVEAAVVTLEVVAVAQEVTSRASLRHTIDGTEWSSASQWGASAGCCIY
jgi:hypothetical protein